MSAGITLDELLAWNDEAAQFWKGHLEANQALLELPCGITGAENVQAFVRHIWGAELRWGQRLAGLAVTDRENLPAGPLEALYGLHIEAMEIMRGLLKGPEESWGQPYVLEFEWIPAEQRAVSRKKVAGHLLFHSQRHWAQLATLVRAAGFPSGFRGDLLFSPAVR